MLSPDRNGNGTQPEVVALQALAWIVSDEMRGERLLSLTGMDAGQLRARADDPAIWAAVLDFLAAHEPDLIACAESLGLPPEALIHAAREISQ
ncbi:MAG: hypothetical protein B7Z20_02670 [Sphingobium sp. 32-64-5]|nr:MAG: hypothetical protein B7Z20_02670 [Sphingobium sp. 32-64-5]